VEGESLDTRANTALWTQSLQQQTASQAVCRVTISIIPLTTSLLPTNMLKYKILRGKNFEIYFSSDVSLYRRSIVVDLPDGGD
jgi:hypothetical protein